MKIVSVIPARGGSKSIVNKNLQLIDGIPLVARSIVASKAVKEIIETYVSSDSDEILEVSKSYGATTINRPENISNDESSTEDVLLHFIEVLSKKNINFDILVCLQCTSPFTVLDDIDGTINALISNDADCALAVTKFHHFLWWLCLLDFLSNL